MPTIDADAHVIETDRTWDYMDEADSKYRPIIVSSQDGKKQFWLVASSAQITVIPTHPPRSRL